MIAYRLQVLKHTNMLRLTFLILLLGSASLQLSAHALWIETHPSGKPGKKQFVNVFYGEPTAGAPDRVADWWSDVSNFTLWLIKPDGSREQLVVSPGDDRFSASFTPSLEGLYTLAISHNVSEIAGGVQYQFNATAMVRVGKATASSDYAAAGAELYVFADPASQLRKGRPLEVSCHGSRGPAEAAYVTAYAPTGWAKSFQADASGKGSFVPEWAGTYLIEAGKGEEIRGKTFTSIYRITTLQIHVPR